MMLLNELNTLGDIINDIPTLQSETQDTRDSITSLIHTMYGERTVFEQFVESPGTAGKMLDLLYGRKWSKIKEGLDSDVSLTEHTTQEKEVKTTEIFGYDGNGTNDTRETTEHTGNNELDNVFDNMTNGIDFYKNFSYYRIVIQDIVSQITLSIYE